MDPIVLVHGGFDDITDARLSAKVNGCKEAAMIGYSVLASGGSVLDAVEAAVRCMENNDIFNAGYGSVLNVEGDVEMDAMIMDGNNLNTGAVTAVRDVANPIHLARLVMENSPHLLFAGSGAKKFAEDNGVPILQPGTLVTVAALESLKLSKEIQSDKLSVLAPTVMQLKAERENYDFRKKEIGLSCNLSLTFNEKSVQMPPTGKGTVVKYNNSLYAPGADKAILSDQYIEQELSGKNVICPNDVKIQVGGEDPGSVGSDRMQQSAKVVAHQNTPKNIRTQTSKDESIICGTVNYELEKNETSNKDFQIQKNEKDSLTRAHAMETQTKPETKESGTESKTSDGRGKTSTHDARPQKIDTAITTSHSNDKALIVGQKNFQVNLALYTTNMTAAATQANFGYDKAVNTPRTTESQVRSLSVGRSLMSDGDNKNAIVLANDIIRKLAAIQTSRASRADVEQSTDSAFLKHGSKSITSYQSRKSVRDDSCGEDASPVVIATTQTTREIRTQTPTDETRTSVSTAQRPVEVTHKTVSSGSRPVDGARKSVSSGSRPQRPMEGARRSVSSGGRSQPPLEGAHRSHSNNGSKPAEETTRSVTSGMRVRRSKDLSVGRRSRASREIVQTQTTLESRGIRTQTPPMETERKRSSTRDMGSRRHSRESSLKESVKSGGGSQTHTSRTSEKRNSSLKDLGSRETVASESKDAVMNSQRPHSVGSGMGKRLPSLADVVSRKSNRSGRSEERRYAGYDGDVPSISTYGDEGFTAKGSYTSRSLSTKKYSSVSFLDNYTVELGIKPLSRESNRGAINDAPCPRNVTTQTHQAKGKDELMSGKTKDSSQIDPKSDAAFCASCIPCPKSHKAVNESISHTENLKIVACGTDGPCANSESQTRSIKNKGSLHCGQIVPCPSKNTQSDKIDKTVRYNEQRINRSARGKSWNELRCGQIVPCRNKEANVKETVKVAESQKTAAKEHCGPIVPCPKKVTDVEELDGKQPCGLSAGPCPNKETNVDDVNANEESQESGVKEHCGPIVPCPKKETNVEEIKEDEQSQKIGAKEHCGPIVPCPKKESNVEEVKENEKSQKRGGKQHCGPVAGPCPNKETEESPKEHCGPIVPCSKKEGEVKEDKSHIQKTPSSLNCGQIVPCPNKEIIETNENQKTPSRLQCGQIVPCPNKETNVEESKENQTPKSGDNLHCGQIVPCPKKESNVQEVRKDDKTSSNLHCGQIVPCPKTETNMKDGQKTKQIQFKANSLHCGQVVPCPKEDVKQTKVSRQSAASLQCGQIVPCPKKESSVNEDKKTKEGRFTAADLNCGQVVPCPKQETKVQEAEKNNKITKSANSLQCGQVVPCPKKENSVNENKKTNKTQSIATDLHCGQIVPCPKKDVKETQETKKTLKCGQIVPCPKKESNVQEDKKTKQSQFKAANLNCGEVVPCPKTDAEEAKETKETLQCGQIVPCPKIENNVKEEKKTKQSQFKAANLNCGEVVPCPKKDAEEAKETKETLQCGQIVPCPKKENNVKEEKKTKQSQFKAANLNCGEVVPCPKIDAEEAKETKETLQCGQIVPCPKKESKEKKTKQSQFKAANLNCGEVVPCPKKDAEEAKETKETLQCGQIVPCPKKESNVKEEKKTKQSQFKAANLNCGEVVPCPKKETNVPEVKQTKKRSKSPIDLQCGQIVPCPKKETNTNKSKAKQSQLTSSLHCGQVVPCPKKETNVQEVKHSNESQELTTDLHCGQIVPCPNKENNDQTKEVNDTQKSPSSSHCGQIVPCPNKEAVKNEAKAATNKETNAKAKQHQITTDSLHCGQVVPCPKKETNVQEIKESNKGQELTINLQCGQMVPCPNKETDINEAKANNETNAMAKQNQLATGSHCGHLAPCPNKESNVEGIRNTKSPASCGQIEPCPNRTVGIGKPKRINSQTGKSFQCGPNVCPESGGEVANQLRAGIGTVGCVVFDGNGNLAAGTSTGGLSGKMVGRSADSCIVGAGGYADNESGAVSITGHGETIMKFCLAHKIVNMIAAGKTAAEATSEAINRMRERLKNDIAGAIAITRFGDIGIYFTSGRMCWAYRKGKQLHYGVEHDQDDYEFVQTDVKTPLL